MLILPLVNYALTPDANSYIVKLLFEHKMAVSLKILLLDNNPADAETVQQLLKKADIQFECRIATNRDQYLLALDQFQPDLILADNSLPPFQCN